MLRKLENTDIDSVIELENSTIGETLGFNMLNDIITNPIMNAYVYLDKDIVKGYISVSFDGYTLEILNFCVDSNSQNKGIGKKLLNYAIINAYKDGCKNVVLEVRRDNVKAIHLYESFGFKVISTRKQYYKDLCDALVYEKKLNDYNIVLDKELNSHCKIEIFDDYIKYSDSIQFDKYYHNFYKLNNESCINYLIEENKDKSFLCFEYNKLLNIEGFDEIDDNIEMAVFLKALDIKNKEIGNVFIVDESNEKEVYDFIFEDAKQFGIDYAKKNSDRIINDIKNNIAIGFIIKDNDKIIGFVNTFMENDICQFEDFFVLDEYQRKGYGSTLIKYVINYFINLGCNMAVLTADNEDTPKNMYFKWGFIEINRSFFLRRGE